MRKERVIATLCIVIVGVVIYATIKGKEAYKKNSAENVEPPMEESIPVETTLGEYFSQAALEENPVEEEEILLEEECG
ncbi:hypothetical protein LJC58_10515, partial [Lachnospiraceae bacterium OttesenSCG-928-D06]|nr:hypothetical protein [Lachnospiraceae bacterium OttesenSCG-928-D06]